MGTQAIPARRPDQRTDASWWNLLKDVLSGDFVPRTLQGNVIDSQSLLGNTTYLWSNLYLSSFLILYYGSFAISIQNPAGTATSYTLKLPSDLPPSGKSPIAVDSSGNSFCANPDSTLDTSSSTTIAVKERGLPCNKLEAQGQQLSAVASSTLSTSFVAVPGASATITTTGRPVRIRTISNGGVGGGTIQHFVGGANGEFRIMRGATEVARFLIKARYPTLGHIDEPSAGTYTYTIEYKSLDGSNSAAITAAKLVVFEYQ
jgi:hypothetical protein